MPFYELILGSLAVWRLTHLLHAENGPWEILARLRGRLGASFWGQLVSCFYCLSLWVSAPVAYWLGHGWSQGAFLWLGMSAAAILLERVTSRMASAALYYEDEEANKHGM